METEADIIKVETKVETKVVKRRKKLYNLTLHNQYKLSEKLKNKDWDVEISPRITAVSNHQNWLEMKGNVLNAMRGIPKGSCVLVGGMTQLALLIFELREKLDLTIYYIKLERVKGVIEPLGVDRHRNWNEEEIEDL